MQPEHQCFLEASQWILSSAGAENHLQYTNSECTGGGGKWDNPGQVHVLKCLEDFAGQKINEATVRCDSCKS